MLRVSERPVLRWPPGDAVRDSALSHLAFIHIYGIAHDRGTSRLLFISYACAHVSQDFPYINNLACDWRSPTGFSPSSNRVRGHGHGSHSGTRGPLSDVWFGVCNSPRREDGCTIPRLRRLYGVSEAHCRRFEPEQRLTSPHNEAVTSYLVGAILASPHLTAENDDIVSACKTYYESVRRSFRYKQPELASRAENAKSLARSRSRRKRLLEARRSVLAEGEMDI
nr:uncharacterized protein LOC129453606 [Misgurnus anguillicaudatus]